MNLIAADEEVDNVYSVDMKSLHAMVREAAVNHGDKTAAIFDTGASRATCLTYHQLAALGNELCRHLQGAVGENARVLGVFCDVSIFLPVWIFRYVSLSDTLYGQTYVHT